MNRFASGVAVALLSWSFAAAGFAEEAQQEDPPQSAEEKAYYAALDKLQWVKGPATVEVAGNSQLALPEGFVFLDQRNTDKFLELNQNIASGQDVLVAPADMHWSAYFSFADEGYVKDDEKIDAPKLLQAMKEGTEQSNEERRKRGWSEMHVVDWAVSPAYNPESKRLEWATLLESEGRRNVNFSTKVLGRRGHTSIVLVASVQGLSAAQSELEQVLAGYTFKAGDTYAEWVPGDKVAEYGLAALVLGGAAAIATKKGLWAVLAAFLLKGWKIVAVAGVGLAAGYRKFFGKKTDDTH